MAIASVVCNDLAVRDEISRSLSKVLRYKLTKYGIPMSVDGFARVDQLLQVRCLSGVSVPEVLEAVATSFKCNEARFETQGSGVSLCIRATRKHSPPEVNFRLLASHRASRTKPPAPPGSPPHSPRAGDNGDVQLTLTAPLLHQPPPNPDATRAAQMQPPPPPSSPPPDDNHAVQQTATPPLYQPPLHTGVTIPLNPAEIDRNLSKVLRHKLTQYGIPMSVDGFARVDQLLQVRCLSGVSVQEVLEAVATSFKRNEARFETQGIGESLCIRATRKHSRPEVNFRLRASHRSSRTQPPPPPGSPPQSPRAGDKGDVQLTLPAPLLHQPPPNPDATRAAQMQPPPPPSYPPPDDSHAVQQMQPPPPPCSPPPDDNHAVQRTIAPPLYQPPPHTGATIPLNPADAQVLGQTAWSRLPPPACGAVLTATAMLAIIDGSTETVSPVPEVRKPTKLWQKYNAVAEDQSPIWWWCEGDGIDCFFEAHPGKWCKYADPTSEKCYWWLSDDSWFWVESGSTSI